MRQEQNTLLEERDYVHVHVRLPKTLVENLRADLCDKHGLNLSDCVKLAILLLLETE